MSKLIIISAVLTLFLTISCQETETDSEYNPCFSDSECALNYRCDLVLGTCVPKESEGSAGDSDSSIAQNPESDNQESDKIVNPSDDGDPVIGECNPGDYQKEADMFQENKGECIKGVRKCSVEGKWEEWKAMWAEFEECSANGIDEDCDGTVDNFERDYDGDGYGRCKDGTPYDCCEIADECGISPELVNPSSIEFENNVDDNCNGEIDENKDVICDQNLSTSDPMSYAKAMGLCTGVLSAAFHLADGTGTPKPYYGINPGFGGVIVAKEGNSLAILSTNDPYDPTKDRPVMDNTSSKAPSDWIEMQPEKQFPVADACPDDMDTTEPDPDVNDPVMLELKLQVPTNAKAFSFESYFLSIEYPTFICSQYNDFFLALLTSDFNNQNSALPEMYKNPEDKNLAMDENGNPVGVNLAPAGLFTQCENTVDSDHTPPLWEVTSCEGVDELVGTGFGRNPSSEYSINHGGTGWLVTRGNVVPGEEVTLRLVIWNTGDHRLNSTILLDNFKWEGEKVVPGTGSH